MMFNKEFLKTRYMTPLIIVTEPKGFILPACIKAKKKLTVVCCKERRGLFKEMVPRPEIEGS